ncbi:anaerobic ribonucleoside-triphosphate reductase activating protein [Peptacetobacter hiranonis]|uniref:Anaerobic ribonucleoside-triphosphate reductase-activating protein n=1 Tax=Peptacetobacter hiranonis (strain DSM 13275 / JCM 10541 / KCTC 15199 / TO-931) TaxID=500633 RepID=B6FXD5_PEPHT|nr:anaerobic ribonucleoside-triphosphate reductase activating protein [Peptacetobacter hiranonis]EEA85818.1 anaerobic ribonucleoside-triphosphate reductase activating protein [Peptacetobacter hiranonis DSM 13275]QEK20569.1 Anaerobic ribonucleoside-triphosphate reductase-activating protein [Peptacetobacter hiranonis]
MRYEKIRKFDVSNAPGVRSTLFVTGCTHDCKGCFNKELQDFGAGDVWTQEDEDNFVSYVKNDNVVGVNILGGEPMQQVMDDCLPNLLKRVKEETGKSIWLWSGYLLEQILEDEKRRKILEYVDVLVDGRFEIDKRNINLKYRGSENQRVIDIKKTLMSDSVVLYDFEEIL